MYVHVYKCTYSTFQVRESDVEGNDVARCRHAVVMLKAICMTILRTLGLLFILRSII